MHLKTPLLDCFLIHLFFGRRKFLAMGQQCGDGVPDQFVLKRFCAPAVGLAHTHTHMFLVR